jgi:hydroxyacylglutathione hydrolase
MLLRRFYHTNLAQASYLVGCQRTGEALVIDPNRHVRSYLDAAAAEGLRITGVTETHIHADFVSGSRELARHAEARLYLSDEGDAQWKYAFAAEPGTTLLKDGHTIHVGNVRLDVLHTPGHTPEHLSFVLTDTAVTDRPMGAFTGDFLFVGDVGRPDLLERTARVAGTMESSARTLFRSLQRFRAQPDYLQIWPGHGAGSACGKALGAVPQSTLGYEKLTNWAFGATDESEFARAVLAGQPDPPKYFAEMKRINKAGPPSVGDRRTPRQPVEEVPAVLRRGATVIDVRSSADFAGGHLPGTINIPYNASFITWAGWLVPYTTDVYLITDEAGTHRVENMVRDLALIGLDRVAGFFGPDALANGHQSDETLQTIPGITPTETAHQLNQKTITVIDVRAAAEWESARIPGVPNIPLGHLPDRTAELSRDKPIAVHCQSGARSAIAASILQSLGFKTVLNLQGGIQAWQRAGLPLETRASESTS